MNAISLVSYFLLPILLIFLLSTVAQATDYREVKSTEILKQIENGEEVNLTHCRIVGELNVSSSVIKSNITIKNSIFENDFNFSKVRFNNSVVFDGANFNNSANFYRANFNNFADFSDAHFNNSAIFSGANFNNSADFSGADFNNSAVFDRAYFNNSADFSDAHFNNSAIFSGANFNNSADFSGANFNDIAILSGANFNNSADFYKANFENAAFFFRANFNDSAIFSGTNFKTSADFFWADFSNSAAFDAPETSENIFTTEKNYGLFMECYNKKARYTDADNIYYNYRKEAQDSKDLITPSKWTDILSWVTCGYGTKLSHTLYCSLLFIMFFAYIYRPHTTMSVLKSKNNVAPVKVYWKESGIYNLSDAAEKKSILSFWDDLYFSINTFTRLGSVDWHSRDDFRKWVTLEGLLGWITLALVMSTLMKFFR